MCQLMQLVFGAGSNFTMSTSADWNQIYLSAKFDENTAAPLDRAEMSMKV